MKIIDRDFSVEFEFKYSRSSGKGGQHVNKTESRVSLFFDIQNSELLKLTEKNQLSNFWRNQVSQDGVLQIDVEESRSQKQNRKIAVKKFEEGLKKAFRPKKRRKATKPTRAAIRKRLKDKKRRGEKKQNRRNDNIL